jgi:hypothetical protein
MSTTNFENALAFLPPAKSASKRPHILAALGLVARALREGHAASQQYHELTARGVPHEKAVKRVFADHFSA